MCVQMKEAIMKRSRRNGRRDSCAHRKRPVDPAEASRGGVPDLPLSAETLQGLAEARTSGRAFPRPLHHNCFLTPVAAVA
jgi:hypothetical protein